VYKSQTNEVLLLVRAPIDYVTQAFQGHRRVPRAVKDAYGELVELSDPCFLIYQLKHHPWTEVSRHAAAWSSPDSSASAVRKASRSAATIAEAPASFGSTVTRPAGVRNTFGFGGRFEARGLPPLPFTPARVCQLGSAATGPTMVTPYSPRLATRTWASVEPLAPFLRPMHHRDHVVIRGRGRRGLDVDDQVRRLRVARLGQMHVVPDPLHPTLGAVAGLRVVGRADQFGRRGQVLDLAPPRLARVARELLGPDAAQGHHRRDPRQHGLSGRRIHGGQEPLSVRRDHPGQLLAGRIGHGQVVVLDAPRVALVPLRRGQYLQPVGVHHGQVVRGGPHRLAVPLQPVEHADGGQDMGRVGALPAPLADQSEFPAPVQEGVQEQLFGLAVDQVGAEFAQHGVVEAGVVQLQAEGVLPVDATMDGVGGLAIRQALDVLEDGGQGQPGGRGGRLAAGGKQAGELVVTVERSEFISDAEAEGALGEGGVGDAPGLFGDYRVRLGVK
jgi:hypothetical protein